MAEPTVRVPISKRLRFEVFKRDQFRCQYCGFHPPDVVLEVDHIIAVSEGGTNDADNLVTACFACNRGKANVSIHDVAKSMAEKTAEMIEREAQLEGYRVVMQARADRIEADMWAVANVLEPSASTNGYPHDWLRSIMAFNEKLPIHVVLDMADLARARVQRSGVPRFLYFCKCCWNAIRSEVV